MEKLRIEKIYAIPLSELKISELSGNIEYSIVLDEDHFKNFELQELQSKLLRCFCLNIIGDQITNTLEDKLKYFEPDSFEYKNIVATVKSIIDNYQNYFDENNLVEINDTLGKILLKYKNKYDILLR